MPHDLQHENKIVVLMLLSDVILGHPFSKS